MKIASFQRGQLYQVQDWLLVRLRYRLEKYWCMEDIIPGQGIQHTYIILELEFGPVLASVLVGLILPMLS